MKPARKVNDYINFEAVRIAMTTRCGHVYGTSKLVLIFLCKHLSDKTGLSFPSVRTLASETGLNEKTVAGALANLRRRRLITIHEWRKGYVNRYRIHLEDL